MFYIFSHLRATCQWPLVENRKRWSKLVEIDFSQNHTTQRETLRHVYGYFCSSFYSENFSKFETIENFGQNCCNRSPSPPKNLETHVRSFSPQFLLCKFQSIRSGKFWPKLFETVFFPKIMLRSKHRHTYTFSFVFYFANCSQIGVIENSKTPFRVLKLGYLKIWTWQVNSGSRFGFYAFFRNDHQF